MLIMLELDGQYRTEGNEPHDMRAFQHGRTNGAYVTLAWVA